MNDLVKKVDDFESKTHHLGVRSTSSEADRVVSLEMAEVRTSHERNGFQMANPRTLDDYEANFRTAYDRQLLADGVFLEAERDALVAEVTEAIAARQPLPSRAQQHPAGSEKRLFAEMLDELQLQRVRQELQGLTRGQVLDRFTTWTDEDHGPEVRTIEAAVLAGGLDRLGIRDADPIQDAIVIPKLREAVQARRRGRVPAELLAAQQRLEKIFSLGHTLNMTFLRQGLGVASRSRARAIA